MSIFTNWTQSARMMLSKSSSIKKAVAHAMQWLDNIDIIVGQDGPEKYLTEKRERKWTKQGLISNRLKHGIGAD